MLLQSLVNIGELAKDTNDIIIRVCPPETTNEQYIKVLLNMVQLMSSSMLDSSIEIKIYYIVNNEVIKEKSRIVCFNDFIENHKREIGSLKAFRIDLKNFLTSDVKIIICR